jgi:hypothetical protein
MPRVVDVQVYASGGLASGVLRPICWSVGQCREGAEDGSVLSAGGSRCQRTDADGRFRALPEPVFPHSELSVEKFQRIWIDFPEIGRVGFIVTRDGNPAPPGLFAVQSHQFVAPSNSLVRQVLSLK